MYSNLLKCTYFNKDSGNRVLLVFIIISVLTGMWRKETKQDKTRQNKREKERERERKKEKKNEWESEKGCVYYCMLNVLTPFETNIDKMTRVIYIYTILCTMPTEGF